MIPNECPQPGGAVKGLMVALAIVAPFWGTVIYLLVKR